ncbi:MAG TPA: DUF2207 domain-containing protein [Candidatus Saccharimonadales bacterium]|nr:DUF2207 domain-containing protein [Candidatus Saccharimonadales bacterium]
MKWMRVWLLITTLGIIFGGASPVHARNVNDFTIQSFDASYTLSKDAEGRSLLKTTETIAATFPEADQNHGIERAIPEQYDGHSVHLSIEGVKDETGTAITYDTYESNDNLVLRIGDPNVYVHGQKRYVISYVQHDVTKYFTDTESDEWYWDVNGTEWSQPIDKVHARVQIDSSLMPNATSVACYQGTSGSRDTCDGAAKPTETMDFNAQSLAAGETLTVAIGFKPQTFAAYQPTAEEKVMAFLLAAWLIALIVGFIIAVAAVIWMAVLRHRVMHRQKGRQTVIPEYLPPKDFSVLVSAEVKGEHPSATTAQLLDFAVRHYIKIYETKQKTFLRSAEYELEIIKDTSDLHAEEKQLLKDLFGDPSVGARFEMKKLSRDYTMRRTLIASGKKVRSMVRNEYALFERATKEAKILNRVSTILIILAIVTLSPPLLIAAIIGYSFAYSLWPLTAKGKELEGYLDGLKLYISVAEEERLKMLQSPEGAEKVGLVNGDDVKQLVKLYERVLPYAVLFGQSKEWVKQLGAYYDESSVQPEWYSGNGAFNAVIFSSAMTSFNSQMTSYGSSDSSSSGGSSGGGFAGGGGGGGGGGGW